MLRTKAIKAGAYALLTVTGFVAINAACSNGPFAITECGEVDRSVLYDGIWILERINTSLLPTNDPTDASRRINAGTLTFTTVTISGNCDKPTRSRGQVSGSVSYTQGGSSPNRKAGGSFKGDHDTVRDGFSSDLVTLSSAEGSAEGKVLNGVMTFANISDARFVLANKGTVTLVFRRF